MAHATKSHFITCPLCEAMCGLRVETRGVDIVTIRGDKDDPFSSGHICPKGSALADLHTDPDRLKKPLRKRGDDFEEIGWQEAFDEVAERLNGVRSKYGRHAVGAYLGNPTVHSSGAMLFGTPFFSMLRTRNRFSATSLDQLPQMLAALEMFGHQLLIPVPDVDRTDFFLVVGANPLVSGGSLMSAPGMKRRMEAISARGGKIVVVDPRRTRTAEAADRHLSIVPGTDGLLLFALVREVFATGTVKSGPLTGTADEHRALAIAAEPFTLERVSEVTGIAAAHIATLAADLMGAKSAAIYGRFGACTQEFGGLTAWLLNVLAAITGNLDVPGGLMFPQPAIDTVKISTKAGSVGHFDAWQTRGKKWPEFGGELPAASMSDEIARPGERQMRALITHAGNPVLSTPGGEELAKALAQLEFMVSIDPWVNETTRHANVILPPTGQLEREHYDLMFHALAVRNTAKWSGAVFERKPDQRHDWEIFTELARRLEGVPLAKRMAARAQGAAGHRRVVDMALRTGPYGNLRGGMSVAALIRSEHGVDLGPLKPCLSQRICTKDRKMNLASKLYLDDVARLRARLERKADVAPSLVAIGRRQLRSNNSWMHNAFRLAKGRDRCTLLMHPVDAQKANVCDGDIVQVRSALASLQVPVQVSDEVRKGVVSLPHGFGHDKPGTRLSVASQKPGASLNALISADSADPLTGNAKLSGIAVKVERVSEPTGDVN